MKYGRTSVVNFLSQLSVSVLGFAATIALTNVLGKEQYGTYVVVLAVLSWVGIGANLGLSPAIKKRVSEASEGNYVVAGGLAQFGLYLLTAICLWFARPYLNAYMGIEATLILVVILGGELAFGFVRTVLEGQHLVHLSSVLSPIERAIRSALQIVLVLLGFGFTGAFAGFFVAKVLAAILGSYYLSARLSLPSREDFRRLRSYAQFSWLGSIKGKAFLSLDTIVLAFFVSKSLIAVYGVAWNLASIFAIFGFSIRKTLFPEMSRIATEGEEVNRFLRVSLTYAGLFIIPGLVGSAIVGDVVLTIYGEGFETGYYVLLISVGAQLLYGYQSQFLNALDAIDRPDLTFVANAVFVGTNLGLNILLTWQFGWYGAAAATATSTAISLLISYYYTRVTMDISLPLAEISKQWLAAGVMVVGVTAGRVLIGSTLPVVFSLVVLGAGVYFLSLLGISRQFRTTVNDNLPVTLHIEGE